MNLLPHHVMFYIHVSCPNNCNDVMEQEAECYQSGGSPEQDEDAHTAYVNGLHLGLRLDMTLLNVQLNGIR